MPQFYGGGTELVPGVFVKSVTSNVDNYNMTLELVIELQTSMTQSAGTNALNEIMVTLARMGTPMPHAMTTSPYVATIPLPEEDANGNGTAPEMEEEVVTLQTLKELLEQRLDDIDQALRLVVEA